MRRGEFEAAWNISDAALRARAGVPCWHLPRHLQYVWDGTPLDGQRVLVRCYHGLGDTIQFARYAPLVKVIATEVIVWAQPALIPLLHTARGIDRIVPLHDGRPDVAYDVDVEIMELAHVLRTTLSTVPARVPYLHVPPAPIPTDGRLAVGIAWEAGDWDEHRSIPFSRLTPLTEIPGVVLHVLQREPGPAERHRGFRVTPGADSVLGTARIMRTLDLVISVDSMPAHLAGALGVPVWTLLPHNADWRWMEDRADSPWYPTMRLFRQERPGEWDPVIARVAAGLKKLSHRMGERGSDGCRRP